MNIEPLSGSLEAKTPAVNSARLPSYHEVLRIFSERILAKPTEHVYLEYQPLLQEWLRFKASNEFGIESLIDFVAKYSIDTKSPYFLAKLYSGSDSISLLADMLISYFNTNVHVYSVSPVFTMAEQLMVERMSRMIDSDDPEGYGIGLFLPGGSYCNMVGIIMARHAYDRSTKTKGMSKRASIVTSIRSHYSVDKAAIIMGIGVENVIKVDFDEISVADLEHIIVTNDVFCICSTFGTTSEGVLESVVKFRDVLKAHNVWHHVDGAVGGVLLYSEQYHFVTHELKLADSIALDFHKVANIAVSCSALMTRWEHEGVLRDVTNVKADYLFHDSDEMNYDISSISFQCGRKGDAFRLFMYDSLSDLRGRVEDFIQRVKLLNEHLNTDTRFVNKVVTGPCSLTHVVFTPKYLCDNYKQGDINAMLGLIVRELRAENIFLEYFSIYFRIVPVSPLFGMEEFMHILNRIAHWTAAALPPPRCK